LADPDKALTVDNGVLIDEGTGVWLGAGDSAPTMDAPLGSKYFRTNQETSTKVAAGTGASKWAGGSSTWGAEFQYAEDETESTTTSITFIQKLKLTTPSEFSAGDYFIGWYAEISVSINNKQAEFQVELNDTTLVSSSLLKGSSANSWLAFSGFRQIDSVAAGANDIDLDFRRTETGSYTADIRRARLYVWRV
jgi:hypothetical protein